MGMAGIAWIVDGLENLCCSNRRVRGVIECATRAHAMDMFSNRSRIAIALSELCHPVLTIKPDTYHM